MHSDADIVFIHPYNRLAFEEILPFSVPAIVNRLRVKYRVQGLFFSEIGSPTVARARVAFIDIHWYTMLKGGIDLARRLKRLNPEIIIVAGGLSASLFYRQLFRDSAIDYILRGDGEIPAVRLADAVMENTSLDTVPNLVARDFESRTRYSLTETDFNENDYLDISWFPAFEKHVQRRHALSRGYPFAVHPFLITMRGCPMECEGCSGALEAQRRLFKRECIKRSPEKIKADLLALSEHPSFKFVNAWHDFLRHTSKQEKLYILDQNYDLALYYDFFDTPDEEDLDRLLVCFNGGLLTFTMDNAHGTTTDLADTKELVARIRQVQGRPGFRLRLSYLKQGLQQDRRYREGFEYIIRETRCETHQADWWFESYNPQPDEDGRCSDEIYAQCINNANRYYLFNHLYRSLFLCHCAAPSLVRTALYYYNWLGRFIIS